MLKRILIIDDERLMTRLVAAILTRQGYETHTAASVAEGLKLLETLPFDLITCDLMLPDISGLDFLAMLQEGKVQPHVPMILITGLTLQESLDDARARGAVDILTKPFSPQQLIDAVAKVWNSQPG